MEALISVPCAYGYGTDMVSWDPHYGKDIRANLMDKRLRKRITWIMICGGFSSGYLHALRYFKSNEYRFFLEVLYVFVPVKMPYGYTYKTVPLAHHICYYLGTYPSYWSPRNKLIVPPNQLMTTEDFPMGSKPSGFNPFDEKISVEQELDKISNAPLIEKPISDDEIEEWSSLETDFGKDNMEKYLFWGKTGWDGAKDFYSEYPDGPGTQIDHAIDKMAFFHKKPEILQWLQQKNRLDKLKDQFQACLDKNYPKPKKPQYKTLTPQGPSDFPGAPMNEMQLPAPETQPSLKAMPSEKIIKLSFFFFLSTFTARTGYTLVLHVEEVKV
jgi:hypothetical protein